MQWEKEETEELQRRWPCPILPWQLYHLCELIGAECRVHLGPEMDRNNLHFLTVFTKQPHCPTEQDTGGTSEQNKTTEKKPFKPFGEGKNISHVSEKHTRNGDLCFCMASKLCLQMTLWYLTTKKERSSRRLEPITPMSRRRQASHRAPASSL